MKMLPVNYRLPIFGDQKIPFRAESAQLFRWLEKNNEIRRLTNLDQLGVLKRRFSCAHHSKFEYAIMLSYLIELIKKDEEFKYKYALSRPYEEKKVRVLSSISELLKCWAFLLPLGHLHGTFPHERAILRIITSNKGIRDSFQEQFNAYPSIQKQVNSVIDNDNYYKLHQAFAVLKLHDYKISDQGKQITRYDKVLVNKYIKYLGFYISPSKDVFKKAKTIFANLRKIAYILLDSYYCNLIFSFNANHISIETIKASLQEGNSNRISNLWDALDNYLMQELYKNTECLLIENLAYRAFFKRLQKEKKDISFLITMLRQPESSYMEETFNDYLSRFKTNLHQDCEYHEVLNLSIIGLRLFDIERSLDTARKAINKKVAYLNYVVDKNIKTNANDIYIYLKNLKKIQSNSQLARHLIGRLISFCIISQRHKSKITPSFIRKFFSSKESHPGTYYSFLGSGNWNKLVFFMVGLAIKSKYSLRPVPIDKDIPIDSILIDGKTIKKLGKSPALNVKNSEFEDLIELANDIMHNNKQKKVNGKIVIYPFNIKIIAKDNKNDEGDIDSVLVNFIPNRSIELFMLQSKVRGQRYQDSKKQAAKIKQKLTNRLIVGSKSSIIRLSKKSKTSILKINFY